MKPKQTKPNSKTRELMASEQALIDKWSSVPKFAGKYPVVTKKLTREQMRRVKEKVADCHFREQPTKDKFADMRGPVSSKPAQKYTGTKMLGIGQMHKSNAVPVFQEEDAVAIATMRR